MYSSFQILALNCNLETDSANLDFPNGFEAIQ